MQKKRFPTSALRCPTKKVRTGDRVTVIAGNARSQSGVIRAVQGERVIVEGVNLRKKHVKAGGGQARQGTIVDKEMPIHISNVKRI